MNKNKTSVGQCVLTLIMAVFVILFMLPIILILISSLSSEQSITLQGFSFTPLEWSLDAWRFVWDMREQIFVSYRVTIFVTVMGTGSSLLLSSMLAYTLSRKQFKLRNFLSIFLLITMLFNGGELSHYMINSTVYGLKDTLAVLWMPWVSAMNVFMMRSYIQSNITDSLVESARIDGAGEFRVYWQICLPLMKPVLASVGFMLAISYWNEWQKGLLYISSPEKVPLQLLLMRIEMSLNTLTQGEVPAWVQAELMGSLPAESARMALLFTVLGPVLIAYPFFQKYFVSGLTMGSVKG